MRNGPYILVLAPEGYPGKKYRGRYAYEHTVVWWQNTGTVPPPGCLLHHKNEDKHDNRFQNLGLKPRGKHTAEHNEKPKAVLNCAWCSKKIERKRSELWFRKRSGQTEFYCDRSCEAKHRWSRDGGFKSKE